jgi:hypothetical protein
MRSRNLINTLVMHRQGAEMGGRDLGVVLAPSSRARKANQRNHDSGGDPVDLVSTMGVDWRARSSAFEHNGACSIVSRILRAAEREAERM